MLYFIADGGTEWYRMTNKVSNSKLRAVSGVFPRDIITLSYIGIKSQWEKSHGDTRAWPNMSLAEITINTI